MLSFGNEILKQSISSLVGTGPLPTSVIYPFLQQRAENVHIDARVQLLRNYSSSPHMMLLTRFIRANVGMASSFEVQLLVLIQWTFDSVSLMASYIYKLPLISIYSYSQFRVQWLLTSIVPMLFTHMNACHHIIQRRRLESEF